MAEGEISKQTWMNGALPHDTKSDDKYGEENQKTTCSWFRYLQQGKVSREVRALSSTVASTCGNNLES